MNKYKPVDSFGAVAAAHYDEYLRGDEEAAVLFLSEVAKGRRALEFAIGTGRIALPLQAKGFKVEGIELSPHMIARLREKSGGAQIKVAQGSMSVTATGRKYGLVYLVFNTIFNLLTVEDQIQCFQNAARHLLVGGKFVVETAIPHAWISPGQSDYVHVDHVGVDAVQFDVARYDPVTQLLEENHVELAANGLRMSPIVCRLITPGEMDLMARIAGLRLEARFGSWQRSPFDARSQMHVSVYVHAPRTA